jgi:hypothetical protein
MTFKNITLAAAAGLFSFAACTSETGDSAGVTTVDFHSYTEKPLSEMPDEFYSGKRYVALHADDQSMLVSNLNKIVLRDDKIFVRESFIQDHKIIVHDASGYAVAKVGSQGRGPNEYLGLTDFDVDGQGKVHIIDTSPEGNRLFISDGEYRITDVKELPFRAETIECTPDGGYLFGLSPRDNSQYAGTRFVKTAADLTVENTSGVFDKKLTDPLRKISNNYFADTPEGVFYYRTPDDNGYLLDEGGNIVRTFFFDLGGYAIPAKNRRNLGPVIMGELATSPRYLDMAVFWRDYIFGKLNYGDRIDTYIYDTGANSFHAQVWGQPGAFGDILTVDGGCLITCFRDAFENPPSDLPEDLRAGVADGNPLIALYKLK